MYQCGEEKKSMVKISQEKEDKTVKGRKKGDERTKSEGTG